MSMFPLALAYEYSIQIITYMIIYNMEAVDGALSRPPPARMMPYDAKMPHNRDLLSVHPAAKAPAVTRQG